MKTLDVWDYISLNLTTQDKAYHSLTTRTHTILLTVYLIKIITLNYYSPPLKQPQTITKKYNIIQYNRILFKYLKKYTKIKIDLKCFTALSLPFVNNARYLFKKKRKETKSGKIKGHLSIFYWLWFEQHHTDSSELYISFKVSVLIFSVTIMSTKIVKKKKLFGIFFLYFIWTYQKLDLIQLWYAKYAKTLRWQYNW